MADLKINIVTKYDQAEKGFNKVSGSLQKYRKELIEASNSGHVTDETIQNYVDALNRCLTAQDLTKDGMAALRAQAKVLRGELGQIGLTFGEQGDLFKKMNASLKAVEEEMATTGKTAEKSSKGMESFSQSTNDVTKASDAAIPKLLSVAKNILKFQLLMGPITAVVRGFRNTISDSIKVAAEAEQRFNKLSTVFEGFADSAKRASAEIAASLGVANSTAASALSTVGDLLQAQGMGTSQSLATASSWVKQFQDIIAFKDINMTLEEFAQNFMSGAAGNLRNFRTFGSIVKESAVNAELMRKGLDKLTGSELELAKMTTRAELALKQQANAMGATRREWDTMLSINRRLSEAWKEYKENIGDTINTALKPLKEWWSRILEETNKAKKAQEEYNRGAKESSVHRDVRNNPEDAKNFRSSLMSAVSEAKISLSSLYDMRGQTLSLGRLSDDSLMSEERALIVGQLKNIDRILFAFGVSVEDASEIIGKDIPQAAYRYLEVLEKRRKADKAFLDAQEAREAKLSSAADSFSALQETLLGIAGVNFNPRSITELVNRGKNSDKGMNDAIDMMTSLTSDIIKESLGSLDASDLAQTFGDTISRELGELNEADLLQGRAGSYRKLFEAAWNAYLPDGIDSEESQALEDIKRSYKEATAALEEYNKKLQIQNSILSFKSGLGSIETQTRQIGMTDEEIALDNLRMKFRELTKDANLMTNEELDDLKLSYNRQIVAIRTLYKLQDEYNSKLEREATIKSYIDRTADYRTQLANIGLTDRQIEYNRMNEDARAAWNSGDMDLYKTIVETIQAFNDLNVALDEAEEAEKRRAALEDLMKEVNPFVEVMGAYKLGQQALEGKQFSAFGEQYELTGLGAGLIGVLADILANTEAFQKLASIVTDHIVPVLDAFLEPLLPVIDVIGDLMQSLVQGILVPMFPLIVEICALVTLVVGTIKNIANLIVETIKKVIGSLAYNIMRALDKIIIGDQSHWYEGTWMDQWQSLTPWDNFTNAQEKLLEEVENIRGLTFDIKENTDDKDLLATLKELYSRGIIDEQQFYAGARVKQKDMIFDPVSPTGDHYITNGNITIYVNGGDPAELRRTLEQFFDENNMHYNTAYGRY